MKTAAIVVCTHNREKHLIGCLNRIKNLKKSPGYDVQIAVIDSSEKRLTAKYQKLVDIYIHNKENKPLSVKRNIAIRKVKADIIIFTDDDCIPEKNWFDEIINGFTNSNAVCVTGRTIPFRDYEKTAYEKKFSFDTLGKKSRVIEKHFGLQNLWRFGHGNNMAFLTKIFKKVGLFNTELGVGSKGLRAEDVDMFYRIYKKGYKIVYNPRAIVYHKHLVKEEHVAEEAFKNGYASRIVLFNHHDINCLILYLGGIVKLSIKLLFSLLSRNKFELKTNLYLLLGWLGVSGNLIKNK
jgi:GT2 family glycosyltransferase